MSEFILLDDFFNQKQKCYFGRGGAGDAILTLAAAYKGPPGQIVFFSDDYNFHKELFQTFEKPVILIRNDQYHVFKYHQKFKDANLLYPVILPDKIDYNDWRHEAKYREIINKFSMVPEWREKFGYVNEKIVVIAPKSAHQNYLSNEDYKRLIFKYLDMGYEVYGIGSAVDGNRYYFKEKGTYWLTSNKLCDWQGNIIEQKLSDMLKIINSATEVISVITWLKCYALISGIKTTVIVPPDRGNGENPADNIFLNIKIWPFLRIYKIDDFLYKKHTNIFML